MIVALKGLLVLLLPVVSISGFAPGSIGGRIGGRVSDALRSPARATVTGDDLGTDTPGCDMDTGSRPVALDPQLKVNVGRGFL